MASLACEQVEEPIAAEIVRDFLTAMVEVLRDTAGIEASLAPDPRDPSGESIAVMIRARGALRGVTWSFPMRLVLHVAATMFQLETCDRSTVYAVATELANVLTGLGTRTFEVHGLAVEIEPPELGYLRLPGVWATLTTNRGSIAVILHGPEDAPAP